MISGRIWLVKHPPSRHRDFFERLDRHATVAGYAASVIAILVLVSYALSLL